MKWRATFVAATAAILATGALAACSSSSGNSASSSGDKVTLTFQSLAFQKPTIAAVQKIVTDWNAAHPNIQVKYNQGSWDSVHDQLVTQFQGGTAPDIIHDEAADISGFAQQGYLADISKYLPADVKSSVPDGVWNTVSQNGKIYAVPTLLQSYVVMANTDLLKKDNITIPAGSLSWDQFQAMAKQATTSDTYGLGWGLKSPTATVMSLSLNFGGKFFTGTGQDAKVQVGDAEKQVPERIHAMAYVDKSIDPTTLTQSGTDILPSFYAGKLAMVVEGNYAAQQITEEAPKTFNWTVLPPLTGTSSDQAADPQTLSVSQSSKHQKEAAEFLSYFMQADNLAAVGQGDWLIPTSKQARDAIQQQTGGKNGWTQTLAGADSQVAAPFQSAVNYPRWKDEIATPALQQYLQDKTSIDALATKLQSGWDNVNR
ncbi:MAG TPA: sugar ABC transporter substrate-binding protein [Micromonosporaceae bacterium]